MRTKRLRVRCMSNEDNQSRRGAAVVELAVCIPVLFVVLFASIEACNITFLKQQLVEAAYEGALIGSQDRTTESELKQRVETVLAARNIAGATVTVTGNGSAFDLLAPGERFAVEVDASIPDNVIGPVVFATHPSVVAEVVGHKQ